MTSQPFEDLNLWSLFVKLGFCLVSVLVGVAGLVVFGVEINGKTLEGTKLTVSWAYLCSCVAVGLHASSAVLTTVELSTGLGRPAYGDDLQPVVNDAVTMAISTSPPNSEFETTA